MTPSVSIVVPTWNRRKFVPLLLRHFERQSYPHEDMELIIADDGDDPIEDLLTASRYYSADKKKNSPIRYYRFGRKITQGAKRNFLNEQARGEYIITMDDDDWYGPDYVSSIVTTLDSTDKLICGSSGINCYFPQLNSIFALGPYGANHTCTHFMAYRRAYLANHRFDDKKNDSPEPDITNNFTEPMAQVSGSERFFLLITHPGNTMNRLRLLTQGGLRIDLEQKMVGVTPRYTELHGRNRPLATITGLRLKDVVTDPVARHFYEKLQELYEPRET